jgi:hypothetical protein
MQFVDINNLLNTSKKMADAKKELYCWNLTFIGSIEYYSNGSFREEMQKKMTLSYRQLSLNLSYSNIIDTANLNNIRVLNLSNCYKLTDVSSLLNVFSVSLVECSSINDISYLKDTVKLDLSYCESVEDVSMLGNLNTLNLFCCNKITDISMLNNIPNFKPPDYVLNLPKDKVVNNLDNIDNDYNPFDSLLSHCSNNYDM